jgi:hypothetical protein
MVWAGVPIFFATLSKENFQITNPNSILYIYGLVTPLTNILGFSLYYLIFNVFPLCIYAMASCNEQLGKEEDDPHRLQNSSYIEKDPI